MIQAVIYDMDGVLIDSEPLWRKAEIKIFGGFGVPLTEEVCVETMGLRVDEVVEYWSHRYLLNKNDLSNIESLIMDEVISLVKREGIMLEGVKDSLNYFKEKGVTVALASSSQMRLIDTVIDGFDLREHFSIIYSAEVEEYGKPHPGVYITTAKKLSVPTGQCLAIEDSLNGVLAAKAAKMQCVAVPDAAHRDNKRFGIADVVLDSLLNFNEDVWGQVSEQR